MLEYSKEDVQCVCVDDGKKSLNPIVHEHWFADCLLCNALCSYSVVQVMCVRLYI